jgi:23S rRNA (adenine2030-N6)-methyltransferase
MLSYRHSFHAGNHADVLKHTVQSLIIESLKEKEKPFLYLDTHAGAGRYQLSGEHAERTGEYLEGIARIWQQDDLPAEMEPTFPSSSISTVAASCATTRALR